MRRTSCCSGLALLLCALSAGGQQLAITPYDKSGIYGIGQRVGWTIAVAEGQSAASGGYTYTVKRNNLVVIGTGAFDLSRGPAKIETSLDKPGMLVVEIRPPAGATGFGGRSTGGEGRIQLGAAVDPTHIQPAAPRPADFDAFWETKIKALKAVPEQAVLTPGESGRPDVEYATIKMNNIDGAHVYGQIAKPKREGQFPALLMLQWASPPYPLQKAWVTDRAAEGWLALNIEPHDVPSDMPQAFYDALPQLLKSYQAIGSTDRDQNYFLRMYLSDYRAVDYLASRPDWDGRTLVVMGTSMGGQQSLSVAGLNSRVTHVIVNEPSGADANGALHGRFAGYPFWDAKNPRVMTTSLYFDVVNFTSHIKATSLVAMGFIDDVAPPVGIWTAFNQIRGAKEAAPMIDSPHNNYATPEQQRPFTSRSADWLSALAHGGVVPLKRN